MSAEPLKPGLYLIKSVFSKNLAQVEGGEGKEREPSLTLTNGDDEEESIFWEIKQAPSGRYTIKNKKFGMFAGCRQGAETGDTIHGSDEKKHYWDILPVRGEKGQYIISGASCHSEEDVVWKSKDRTERTPIELCTQQTDRKNHWSLIITSAEKVADDNQDYSSKATKGKKEELSKATDGLAKAGGDDRIGDLTKKMENMWSKDDKPDGDDDGGDEDNEGDDSAELGEDDQEVLTMMFIMESFRLWSSGLEPHLDQVDPAAHQRNCDICDRCIGPETCYQCLIDGCNYAKKLICEDCEVEIAGSGGHDPYHPLLKIPRRGAGFESVAIECDHCEQGITGKRYRCLECDEYDLCSNCKGSEEVDHDPDHTMVLIRPEKCCVCGENPDCPQDHNPEKHGFQATIPESVRRANQEAEEDEDEQNDGDNENDASGDGTVYCYFCDQEPWEIQFKCLSCPEFSICFSCSKSIPETHPTHEFEQLQYKQRPTPVGSRVFCNVCKSSINEDLFSCCHPYCASFDMCLKCATDTDPNHPLDHVLVKFSRFTTYERVQQAATYAKLLLFLDTTTECTLPCCSRYGGSAKWKHGPIWQRKFGPTSLQQYATQLQQAYGSPPQQQRHKSAPQLQQYGSKPKKQPGWGQEEEEEEEESAPEPQRSGYPEQEDDEEQEPPQELNRPPFRQYRSAPTGDDDDEDASPDQYAPPPHGQYGRPPPKTFDSGYGSAYKEQDEEEEEDSQEQQYARGQYGNLDVY